MVFGLLEGDELISDDEFLVLEGGYLDFHVVEDADLLLELFFECEVMLLFYFAEGLFELGLLFILPLFKLTYFFVELALLLFKFYPTFHQLLSLLLELYNKILLLYQKLLLPLITPFLFAEPI